MIEALAIKDMPFDPRDDAAMLAAAQKNALKALTILMEDMSFYEGDLETAYQQILKLL